MPEYQVAWEKLYLPDEEDEENEEESFDYTEEEPSHAAILRSLSPQPINPFFQLKNFNFWTGHVNFKITDEVLLTINNTLGVESLEVVSPYRFHISVGKLFDETEVKANIREQLLELLNEKNRPDE